MRVERFSFRELSDHHPDAPKSFYAMRNRVPDNEPPPPPPEPTFSEEELKAAERAGYQKGFLEGTKDGHAQAQSEQAEVDRILMTVTEKFAQAVAPLFADYRKTVLEMQEHMPQISLAIARKVAGDALSEESAALVENVALRWVETMIHEPVLNISVHDSVAEGLEHKLHALVGRIKTAADITVRRDPALAPTDCRIEWQHGVMDYSTDQVWQQIERCVGTMMATAKHDTIEHLNTIEADFFPAGTQTAANPTKGVA